MTIANNDLVNVQTTETVTKKIQVRVSEHALLKFLKVDKTLSKNIRVYVKIPGGGDYSNMNLDLNECELIVEYETSDSTDKIRVIAT